MATFTQTIIWTALPDGGLPPPKALPRGPKPAQTYKLSVLVSPRLVASDVPDPRLALFPDFLDWPGRKLAFKVKFGENEPVLSTRTSAPPNAKLWGALFNQATVVRPYQFQRLDRNFIFSYPAAAINEFLKRNYADLSTSDSPPPVSMILDKKRFGSLVLPRERPAGVAHRPETFDERIKRFGEDLKRPAERPRSVINQPGPLGDFLKLILFHQPRTPLGADGKRPAVAPPVPDFHDMLAHFGQYPLLMRSLGLIIDLTVPAPPNQADTVMVVPDFHPTAHNESGSIEHVNVTPRTRYRAPTPLEFSAADEAGSDLSGGLLRLDDKTRFGVVQIDADGGGLKAFNLANNLDEAATLRRTADTPQQAGLPALRSGGIAVVRNGRAAEFKDKMRRAFDLNTASEKGAENPSPAVPHKPDDPSRGITLTADDLVRGYRVDVREFKDEQPGPWRSLCERTESYHVPQVQPPVSSQKEEGFVTTSVGAKALPPKVLSPAPKDLYLQETLFRWEGWSLAVRRPGLPLASKPEETQALNVEGKPDPPTASPPGNKSYPLDVRFSVVTGSLPRLRFGSKYQLRARAVDLAGNGRKLADAGESATPPLTYARFEPIAPPTVLLGNARKDGESLERVVIRTGDVIKTPETAVRHVAPPPVAQQLAETHGVFDKLAPAVAYDLIKRRDHEVKNTDPPPPEKVLPEFPSKKPGDKEHLYLPDPATNGALVRINPTGIVENGLVAYYDAAKTWPDFKPFRIELKPAPAGAAVTHKYDDATRTLQVLLPPAETARIQLSSQLTKEELLKMGVFRWMLEFIPAEKLDFGKILKRGLTTINPFRELVLVHAVQQPLKAPQFAPLQAARQSLGQTTAVLSGAIAIHNASTAKVDVLAEWEEFTGRGVTLGKATKLGGPETKKTKAHVGELTVQSPAAQLELGGLKHEFGDTKHRTVHYTASATTRFREYFLTELGKKNPPPLTRESTSLELKIPNSARPSAPKVQYVIPIFHWFKKAIKETDEFYSGRVGGGLRVYLEGPWYSSGEGEMLGVLMGGQSLIGFASERLKPLLTQWGDDPIWKKQAGFPPFLIPEMFPLRAKTGTDLPLAEVADPVVEELVKVAAHEVKFDGARWYSDLQILIPATPKTPASDIPSYYPFIRLGLARYQPESLPGAHLSRVAAADFVQLAPSRLAYLKLVTAAKKSPAKFSTTLTTEIAAHAQLANPTKSIHEILEKQAPAFQVKKNAVAVIVAGVTHRLESQNIMSVALQRATSPRKSELDWEAASPILPLIFVQDTQAPGVSAWFGQIELPADYKPGSYRVVISETEQFFADDLDASGRVVNKELIPPSATTTAAPNALRVVYADTIEI
ncbi:MAG TPA: hypothetical protein VGX48_21030 [Pyrinomonadaceae bacterium]|nr:hypothetical protein [Pyrinomonadaceae bacterium]